MGLCFSRRCMDTPIGMTFRFWLSPLRISPSMIVPASPAEYGRSFRKGLQAARNYYAKPRVCLRCPSGVKRRRRYTPLYEKNLCVEDKDDNQYMLHKRLIKAGLEVKM